MGYEALIQALLAEGEAKAREIETQAEETSRALIQRAGEEADHTAASRARQAAQERDRECREVLARARARAGAITASAKDAAVAEALAAAEQRLEAIAATRPYAACLARLADEALADLAEPSVVRVDERDAEAWRLLLAGRGLRATVAARPDLRCGLEAASADGRVRHRNSFHSRLDKRRSHLVIELAALWSDESAEPAKGPSGV
ncbi:MAG: V-type ATP synthase subunit E family protein [Nitrospiria bacterium]